jgi:glycosyltransferase involved in cell wall biosynthesis
MSKKDVLNWINIPIEVNESYFENRDMLLKNKPNFKARKFLFIGEKRPFDHKGVDILIDAFKLLEKEDIELYLIGKNTDKLEASKNVKCIGFAKNISSYLSESCFFIEPARYETGPITIFESMMAGLIPIFSNNCGHIDCVRQLDNNLVLTSIKPNDIAKKIRQFIKLDEKKLKSSSIKARKLIKDKYLKKDQVTKFKRSFWKLIKRIEERNNA